MKRVILESPFAGNIEKNIAYARVCIRDCLKRGEAPIASHLLFTQPGVLRDEVPEERALGMRAGLIWYEIPGVYGVVYDDLGVSRGMQAGIGAAIKAGATCLQRKVARETLAELPAHIINLIGALSFAAPSIDEPCPIITR